MPEYLILDTTESMRRFRERIRALPFGDEIDEYEIARYLFEYLNSKEEAVANVREYAIQMCDLYHADHTDVSMERFMCALLDLGHDFIQILDDLMAYDERGIFWYSCKGFTMDAALMQRVTEETFVN